MRALVAYGSKMGGTTGLAEMVGAALHRHGVEADVRPAAAIGTVAGYDVVIVGGALYAGRWHRDARRFVKRHRRQLRAVPAWAFSSGPLGDAEQRPDIPPVRGVAKLMNAIAARGHETFGGRLSPDASGFFAQAMAKTWAGDWRDPEQVERWVAGILAELRVTAPAAAGHTDPTPRPPS